LSELNAQQVVTVGVGYADNFGAQVSRCLGNRGGCGEWRAGYFERNLCCWPKSAVDGHQSSTSGNVESGSKFQKIFAAGILAANEYGDSNGEAGPLSTFQSRMAAVQVLSFEIFKTGSGGTSWAKLMMRKEKEQ
jgi:hypothetical protein